MKNLFITPLTYTGLFISMTALVYFVYPNDTIAPSVGILLAVMYSLYSHYNKFRGTNLKDKIFQLLLILIAGWTIVYYGIQYIPSLIKELNIYQWIYVAGFLVAAGGTIFPMTEFFAKSSNKKILAIAYRFTFALIFLVIIFQTTITTLFPQKYQFKSIEEFSTCISLILAGVTLVFWSEKLKLKIEKNQEKQ